MKGLQPPQFSNDSNCPFHSSQFWVTSGQLITSAEKQAPAGDIATRRDLVSLQAIVFMSVFFLPKDRCSTWYTYLCASFSVVVRMGLHRFLMANHDHISQDIPGGFLLGICCREPRLPREQYLSLPFHPSLILSRAQYMLCISH